ncbi:MAG: hydantoinase B/oxoprolinase family protein [Desulfurococcales archaeon]|nr:hydantoinase B/oxoprolinase family protein [Desulfurococcales archaeon]
MTGSLDAATVEVIRNTAISISEEMGVALRNASFSPNIRDRLDYSCAILDPGGNLVAQAEHIPVHLGSMSVGVKSLAEYLESEGTSMEPGDVVLTNDPYIAGTHLNDVLAVKPVYYQGRLVAFVANKAHHVDIGGAVPGSIGAARELREEGLVIEPVKIVERGRVRWDLVKLFEANVRTPRYLRGDLMAQIASLNVGEARLREAAGRHGVDTMLGAWPRLIDHAERYARARIRELPESSRGFFEARDYVESSSGSLLELRLRLAIRHDSVEADYTGSSRQVEEPLNAVYGVTVAATVFALKSVIDPEMPMNQGFFRAVSIRAPEGTIVNPVKPAPVGGGNVETSQRIADVVLRALAQALPERVPAASCGTMSNVMVGGRGWAFYETIACGSGARPGSDGVDGVHTNMTNTLNTPIEVIEKEYPILFKSYELRPDSGGPGEYRGGLGVVRSFTALEDGVMVTIYAERALTRPWGLKGGRPGQGFTAKIIRSSGAVEKLHSKQTATLNRGDTIVIETPGGGGYGEPCKRRRELVLRDLAEGKITREAALQEYCTQ